MEIDPLDIKRLIAAVIRMQHGISKSSSDECEYYEGIEFDGSAEADRAIENLEVKYGL